MRRQAGDVADQIPDILLLRHLRAILGADGDWAFVENGGCHLARKHGGAADAVDAFFHIDGVAHRDDAVLGGDVGSAAEQPDPAAGHAGGDDDLAILLLAHHRQHGDGAVEDTVEVAVQHGVGTRRGHVGPTALEDVDAGVGDKDINALEFLDDPVGDALHRRGVRHVAGLHVGHAAGGLDGGGDGLQRRRPAPGQHQCRPLGGERHCRPLADPRSGPGYPNDLARELAHLFSPLRGLPPAP